MLPIALFLDTILNHLLLVTLLAVWVGMELIDHHGHRLWLGFLPRYCATLPIFAALGLAW